MALPEGSRAVKNRWIFITKRDAENKLVRRRARLVAKGFTQRKRVDYDEVFAPVARYTTARTMLAFAAQKEIEMVLLDLKAAFLNGELEETIYMEQPKVYVVEGKENMVYQLFKALYGLKQASRAWRKKSSSFLSKIGARESQLDPGLYLLTIDGETVDILVYVDDILMLGSMMKFSTRLPR